MRLAAAIQDNLDARAKALRDVLRSPNLWPHGALSEAELLQHRRLRALYDQVNDLERSARALHAATGAVGASGGDAHDDGHAGAACDAIPTGRGAEGGAGSRLRLGEAFLLRTGADGEGEETHDEERAELMRQDALLHRLVLNMKEAVQQGEETLALAQSGSMEGRH